MEGLRDQAQALDAVVREGVSMRLLWLQEHWVDRLDWSDVREPVPGIRLHRGSAGRSDDLPHEAVDILFRGWLYCAFVLVVSDVFAPPGLALCDGSSDGGPPCIDELRSVRLLMEDNFIGAYELLRRRGSSRHEASHCASCVFSPASPCLIASEQRHVHRPRSPVLRERLVTLSARLDGAARAFLVKVDFERWFASLVSRERQV
jgi:hypothetical protein